MVTLRSNRYFHGVSEDFLEALASQTQLYRFDAGETVFWEGDPCLGLYILQEGSVKLYKLSPQGRELIITVFEDDASFNEVPVFDEGTNPVNVEALEDCEIWIVEAEAIRHLIKVHPEAAQAIILNLSQNLRKLVGLVEELSFFQVTNRLARLIYNSPQEQLSGDFSQRMTRDDMAARLGTVREVVARSLRELERSGAIQIVRRQVKVVDQELLQEWAQFPCDESGG
jgi:CRP/FNR family transcriptional regulator